MGAANRAHSLPAPKPTPSGSMAPRAGLQAYLHYVLVDVLRSWFTRSGLLEVNVLTIWASRSAPSAIIVEPGTQEADGSCMAVLERPGAQTPVSPDLCPCWLNRAHQCRLTAVLDNFSLPLAEASKGKPPS